MLDVQLVEPAQMALQILRSHEESVAGEALPERPRRRQHVELEKAADLVAPDVIEAANVAAPVVLDSREAAPVAQLSAERSFGEPLPLHHVVRRRHEMVYPVHRSRPPIDFHGAPPSATLAGTLPPK